MNESVKQANLILHAFIDSYSEVDDFIARQGHAIPKLTTKKQNEIKQKIGEKKLSEVDAALEVCLKAILSECNKNAKNRELDIMFLCDCARIVLCFLGEIHYSAKRLFQYGLADFMAMKKGLWKKTDGDTPKLRCGNVRWENAGEISNFGYLESSSVEYMVSRMEEAIGLSGHESDTRFVDSMKKTLDKVQAMLNASQSSWESRFLNIMESRLMRCGIGKVYRDGLAIFVNSASPDYPVIRKHSADLIKTVEGALNKTTGELPQLPHGYKIHPYIEEISSTLKK